MRALFISPPTPSGNQTSFYQNYYNIGINVPDYFSYLLTSVLNSAHVYCDILDLSREKEPNLAEINKKASEYDCVCFSVNSQTWDNAREITLSIKKELPHITVVFTGIHATVFDEQVLNSTPIDYIVRGECENSIIALLRWLRKKKGEPSSITGITYKKDGKIIKTKDSKLLNDNKMEHLPFGYFDKIPADVFDALPLETSRGYAFYTPFHTQNYLREWRAISPTGIIERMSRAEDFIDISKKKYVHLCDIHFTAKEKRIFDLAWHLRNKRNQPKIKLSYRTRIADLVRESLVECLTEFTEKITLVPYCGYSTGLYNLRKGYNTDIIEDSAKHLVKYNLNDKTEYIFMTGFSWEEEKHIEKTRQFAKHLEELWGVKTRLEAMDNG